MTDTERAEVLKQLQFKHAAIGKAYRQGACKEHMSNIRRELSFALYFYSEKYGKQAVQTINREASAAYAG